MRLEIKFFISNNREIAAHASYLFIVVSLRLPPGSVFTIALGYISAIINPRFTAAALSQKSQSLSILTIGAKI